jgi:hypothetical protein
MATHVGILNGAGDLVFQGTRQELAERIPQQLIVEVDRREEALRLLEASGHAVDARREPFVIRGATLETAREVNRLLVQKGIGVHRLAIELATLESLFRKLTSSLKGVPSH